MVSDAGDRPRDDRPPPLLVTGLSGAGRTTALRALEDAGYEAVDNLPLSLLVPLVSAAVDRPVAVGIDTRTRAFDPDALVRRLRAMSRIGQGVQLLFIDCAEPDLVRRFNETRRRHPLAPDRPVADGIAQERLLLAGLRGAADLVIDTTNQSPHDLRRLISSHFGLQGPSGLALILQSFSYAKGLPRDADIVFDLRFLRNPHWQPELRASDGRDATVQAFIEGDEAYQAAYHHTLSLLLSSLPGYRREGRAYLTVAFGCTGGRHRSVAMAEAVSSALVCAGWHNRLMHRDLDPLPDEGLSQKRNMKEQE